MVDESLSRHFVVANDISDNPDQWSSQGRFGGRVPPLSPIWNSLKSDEKVGET